MTSFSYKPPTGDRRIKMMVGRSANRRADSSVEHMSKGGIPVNPAALKAVRELVESGEWETNPAGVLEAVKDAVKSDPGLFVYVAKNMKSLAEEVREGVDPLAQLVGLEHEKLVKLFHISDRDVSSHRLRDATPAQMLRFQHAIISARAAEALGPAVDVSADLAFSGAALRQVGHSMIAWNYPDIYARALLHQRSKGMNLDQELQKLVGMTPAQIGSRFAAEWNLSPELRWAVAPDSQRASPHPRPPPVSGDAEGDGKLSLRDICDLSELFAKANDPAHYPDALEKWSAAELTIENSVGLNLSEQIADGVQKSLAFLAQVTQHAVNAPFFRLPEKPGTLSAEQRALLDSNPFLRRCSDPVKVTFEPVYRLIGKEGVSVEAIRQLVDTVIPSLGFVRGCLYLHKPEQGLLIPALRVGDLPLSAYPVLNENEHHPVAESLHSSVLLKSPFGPLPASTGAHLYCALLGEKHRGVLHLEVAPEQEESPSHQAALLFNAVRHCVHACFGE